MYRCLCTATVGTSLLAHLCNLLILRVSAIAGNRDLYSIAYIDNTYVTGVEGSNRVLPVSSLSPQAMMNSDHAVWCRIRFLNVKWRVLLFNETKMNLKPAIFCMHSSCICRGL